MSPFASIVRTSYGPSCDKVPNKFHTVDKVRCIVRKIANQITPSPAIVRSPAAAKFHGALSHAGLTVMVAMRIVAPPAATMRLSAAVYVPGAE